MKRLLLSTDQTRCYDAAGVAANCPGSGQDASRPKELAPPGERFAVQGDVVLDTLTGALWTRDANPFSFPLSWREAADYTADLAQRNAFGYGNWQLPTRRLLFSLLSHQAVNPALPQGHPFRNVFSGNYWTADACNRLPQQAWLIHMGGARVAKANRGDIALAWPVCPGPAAQAISADNGGERFISEGQLVHDRHTGLRWCRDADAPGRALSWQGALDAVAECNTAVLHGRSDWRLPNIRELESLVSLMNDSPALADGHPFTNVRDVYWSSTTSVYEPRYAWALYTRDGMVGVGFKADSGFYAWPVCG